MKDINLLSLVEIAIEVLRESKEKSTFLDLYNKVSEMKNFTEEEKNEHIAQFYTDITSSGDFIYCGEDLWDLKENQPLDVIDHEFFSEHSDIEGEDEEEKPKKAKKKHPKKYIEEDEEDENDTEDEDYEVSPVEDDEEEDEVEEGEESTEPDEESETTESYEKDIDAQLDESEEEEDEDFDEDTYNSIMDQYEDQY
ncbi:MAG: DNA-directed RNA polymerase subunit delta [Bacillales bacterium]|nr:DNA-directed RNA polymerase subunit delta [Bacillales bacterium]